VPTVSLPLDNVNKFIVSNSIYNIALEISNIIKVHNNLDVVTMYRGDEISVTDGKVNITQNRLENLPMTISSRRLLVNITDTYNEDALTTTAVHQEEQFPIFIDEDIGVIVFPVYIQTDYIIQFTFHTPSKNEIEKVVDDIRVRLSQTRNIFVHDIEYDYVLPDVIEEFISDVHTNKNRLAPQPLEDYFKECSTRRIHLISDLVGGNAALAVRERQTRIVGLFDFSPMPDKPEKDNNVFKFTFDYKFTIDKPSHLVMKYPVMVCNQLLPGKYMDFLINRDRTEERFKSTSASNSLYALSFFEAHRQLENRLDIGLPLAIPEVDDFSIRSIHNGYGILTSFLTDVNEVDKRSLLNLNELGNYQIDSDIMTYIVSEGQYVTHPYSSFVYLGFYQEGRYFNMDTLTIDAAGNIQSTVDISLFKPSRVLLNYLFDLSSLNENALLRLYTYTDKVIIAVIREFIYTYVQFKNEAKHIDEHGMYRALLMVIVELMKRQEGTVPDPNNNTINTLILTLYALDPYVYNHLVAIIYNNYRETIYKYIAKYTTATVYHRKTDTNKDYERNVHTMLMKTVQTSYIVAQRR
jgi:hypothetical protein